MQTKDIIRRPLVFLLPFYLAGLYAGSAIVPAAWTGWLWPLAFCWTAVAAPLFIRRPKAGTAMLAAAVVLIGAAAASGVYAPPTAPGHVYHHRDREGLVFQGRVAEEPRLANGRLRLIVEADAVLEPGGLMSPAFGRIYLTVNGDGPGNLTGSLIRFSAVLREIQGFGNPGVFDYQRFMAGQGIRVGAFLKSPLLMIQLDDGRKSPDFFPRIRRKTNDFFDRSTGEPARGLLKALVLGNRDDISPELQDVFRRTGLAHLLAVSGLHIGAVALLAWLIFRQLLLLPPTLPLRIDTRRTALVLTVFPVLFYAILAGGRPSTTRAAVMVCLFIFAQLIHRLKDPLNALAAAAWIILAISPGELFTASFQLSFSAVAAIIALAPRYWKSPFRTIEHKDGRDHDPPDGAVRTVWSLTIITMSALLGTAPVIAWHFHKLPVLSLPFNLVFGPVVSIILVPLSLAAAGLSLVFPSAAGVLANMAEKLVWILLGPLESASAIPGLEIQVTPPGVFFLLFYYGTIAALFLIRPWRKSLKTVSVLAVLWAVSALLPGLEQRLNTEMTVSILDVGQGNAAHLAMPDGSQIVIDGGGFGGGDFDTGESIVAPFLLSRRTTRLDVLAATHPDIDHSGGLGYLASWFGPREFWSNGDPGSAGGYQTLLKTIGRLGIGRPALTDLHRPRAFGPAEIRVLAPEGPLPAAGSAAISDNNRSLVVKVRFGGVAFLFPGDIETEGEKELIRRHGQDLASDVLIAPHHGAANAMSPAFLDAVNPRFVVFSVGRFNRFGFPSQRALSLAESKGVTIYRTDRDGAVTFTTDGHRLAVKTFR